MFNYDDVENALYRVDKALSVGKADVARAIATGFLDRIGAQAAQYPSAVTRIKAVAAGAREVPSSMVW